MVWHYLKADLAVMMFVANTFNSTPSVNNNKRAPQNIWDKKERRPLRTTGSRIQRIHLSSRSQLEDETLGSIVYERPVERRSALRQSFFFAAKTSLLLTAAQSLLPEDSMATTIDSFRDPLAPLSSREISSMKYQMALGRGTFKKVYSTACEVDEENHRVFALAIERIRSKEEARDEIRGIQLVESIQTKLGNSPDSIYFESIIDWWIQRNHPAEFQQNKLVFPRDKEISTERTQKRPTSFIGKTWYLISFKQLYDMDLKRFSQKVSTRFHIQTFAVKADTNPIAGIHLDEKGAMKLAYELCHAGKILHEDLGIIHRDIKPKNIMLSNGHALIIDFGFAMEGKVDRNRSCVTEIGKVKGEVKYVLAEDVALYRGCEEGDTFAMGRTMYEVFFDEVADADSGQTPINFGNAKEENDSFLSLVNQVKPGVSRFSLSTKGRDHILYIVRELCNPPHLSFREAEEYIRNSISSLGYSSDGRIIN